MFPEDPNEELDFHFAEMKAERMGRGDSEEQAERYSRAKLGNRTKMREEIYRMSPLESLETFIRYGRFAVRTLARHKASYSVAIGILALGMGMSVAMFSLVDAVLLRPLPFPKQDRIEVIWKKDPLAGPIVGELAYPELRDLQENIKEFEAIALMPTTLYGYARVLRDGAAEPVQIESTPVSHDFFRVLGVTPALGRDFSANDEHPGAQPVVMLSDRVWRAHFSSDVSIVGRMINLNGQGYSVIGVMGRGVEFPRGAGMWIPLGVTANVVERRGATFLQAIARRGGQASHDAIANQINALFQRQAIDHPENYSKTQEAMVTPLPEYWTGSARLHLWIMMAAALLLLVAAMMGAGNLFLSRTMSRGWEIATRGALGARRGQIILQLAAESAVAAMIAAVGGLAIAQLMIRLLTRLAPPDIPRLEDASLNPESFCVAAGVSVAVAIGSAALPAWLVTDRHLESALREGGLRSSLSRAGARTKNVFILAQAAVTMMLLSMACLLGLSYRSMMTADLGFGNKDALTVNLALRGPGLFSGQAITAETRRAFYVRLLERVRREPGVTFAGAVLVRPLEGPIGWDADYEFEFESGSNTGRQLPKANYEVITPGYLQTVGTPLLEGRDFNEHDTENGEQVVIIDQTLALRIKAAGHPAIGHRVRLRLAQGWLKVVGVVADARYRGIMQNGNDVYVPNLQAGNTAYVAVRGTRPKGELLSMLRRVLTEQEPGQALAGAATISELIEKSAARHRFNMTLLLWFAACAAVLAAGGVYSVISGTVTERRREIAIKSALGARRHQVVREVTGRCLRYVVAGAVIGMAGTVTFARLGSDLLYGVSGRDPFVLGGAFAFLLLTALISAWLPAWLATGTNPRSLLQSE